jgi:hypothetical protein
MCNRNSPIYMNLAFELDLRTAGAHNEQGYSVIESEINVPIFPVTGEEATRVTYRAVVKVPTGEKYLLFATYDDAGEPYSLTAKPWF